MSTTTNTAVVEQVLNVVHTAVLSVISAEEWDARSDTTKHLATGSLRRTLSARIHTGMSAASCPSLGGGWFLALGRDCGTDHDEECWVASCAGCHPSFENSVHLDFPMQCTFAELMDAARRALSVAEAKGLLKKVAARAEATEEATFATMKQVIMAAPLPKGYLNRVVYQPLKDHGLAIRVQEAFGHGHLYTRVGSDLIFTPDPSIPSYLVIEALQTTGVDRVVAEAIEAEAAFAADRHASGSLWTTPELRGIPKNCTTSDFRAAYLAVLRTVLQDPGYRDRVGADLPEIF